MAFLARIVYSLAFVFLAAYPFQGAAQTVAFSTSATASNPGGSASIAVSIANSGGAQPAALEWILNYPASAISGVTVVPGPAAVAAGKSVSCVPSAGSLHCLAFGINNNFIANGDIADASFSLASTFTSGSAALQMFSTTAVALAGSVIASTGSNGAISIAGAPPSLSSVACSPASGSTPVSLTCQVVISAAAPTAGFAVAISSNNANLTLPSSLTVPAGSTSASFSGNVPAMTATQTVIISVTANHVSQSSSVTLSAAPLVSAFSCSVPSLSSSGIANCSVTISPTAPAPIMVSLSRNVAALTVPPSVTIASGAPSGSFAVSAGAVGASQPVAITASLNNQSMSATMNLVGPPVLTGLTCTPATVVTSGAVNCMASLNTPAVAGGAIVNLSSTGSSVSLPATVAIPAGASSAAFAVMVGSVTAAATVSIDGSFGASSAAFTLTLTPQTQIGNLSCSPAAVLSGASVQCAISLNSAAPSGGTTINLSSTNTAIVVPSSVTVAGGALSAAFSAVTSASATDQLAWIAATANGGSRSVSLLATHAAMTQMSLLLRGQVSEISGSVAGASVTPSASLPTMTGTVMVNGAGSVNFTPARDGSGVYFASCCTNTNNAYYQFAGAAVGSVFNAGRGQASFYLTSRYSFAQRTANAASARYAFDVRDANGHQFYFLTQVVSGSLEFTYMSGGTAQYYNAPRGTEDALFGAGVSLKVTLTWNGSTMSVYLNDMLVKSSSYQPLTPNWTAASVFNLGAYEYTTAGGYDSSDDAISDFVVTGPAQPQLNFTCSPAAVLSGASAQCTISLNSAAPPGGTAIGISSSNPTITVPTTVMVAAGATSATFSAATAASATDQLAWIAATGNGVSRSVPLLATHAAATQMTLLLRGQASETSGLTSGATVTPSASLPQMTGAVVVNGTGAVNFAPARDGSGVFFGVCCTNTNSAYFQFTGAAVGSVFNATRGQASFYLTSRYSFAQRTANAASARYAFDVRDANGHQFYFLTQVVSGSLEFTYMTGGTAQYYNVPRGTEDALFGAGVSLKITLTWNGSTMSVYLNDTLVKSGPYQPLTPNWTAASLFDFGAYEYVAAGGYDSCDDAISDFVVTGAGGQ